MRLLPKDVVSLWTLFTAPTLWALHFLACYVTAAVFCAKTGGGGPSYDTMRLWLSGITVLALAAILVSALLAFRQWGFGVADPPHDAPTERGRLLFQGFATLLLSGLSFVAVLFTALPLLFIAACQP